MGVVKVLKGGVGIERLILIFLIAVKSVSEKMKGPEIERKSQKVPDLKKSSRRKRKF